MSYRRVDVFSPTVAVSVDLHYKLLPFFSFNIWWRRSFGQGFLSHQQGDTILYNTDGELDCLLKANFASKLLAEIWGIVRLILWQILHEKFPTGWLEERIPSTDRSSYLRTCLREEFVCKVRSFLKCCFLEMNFHLIGPLYRTTTHREFVQWFWS